MKVQWFCRNIYALSGYSDEARGMIGVLQDSGVQVTVVGENRYPWMGGYSFQDVVDMDVPIVYHTFRHSDYQIAPGHYSIIRTMLEVDRIPPNWVDKLRKADEVWVPSRFNRETFVRSGVDPSRVFVIQSPVAESLPFSETPFKLPTRKKFIFLSLFDYGARDRKGLDVLLEAYVSAFGPDEDVALVIKGKTSIGDLKKSYSLGNRIPEICVVNRMLNLSEYQSLFCASNCFVLPTRGEGICRPIMTAMNSGVPVIATGWGGHCEYMNDQNAFLIDFRLSDVPSEGYLKNPGFYGARWAEPDIDHLKTLMKEIKKNPGIGHSKILRGRQDMRRFSGEKIGKQMMDRFHAPLPKNSSRGISSLIGERLYPVHPRCPEKHRFSEDLSVGLIGGGVPLRKAVHFFKGLNVSLHTFEKSGLFRKTVDILVIADFLKNIPSLYHHLVRRESSLPIYVFDF